MTLTLSIRPFGVRSARVRMLWQGHNRVLPLDGWTPHLMGQDRRTLYEHNRILSLAVRMSLAPTLSRADGRVVLL